MIETKVCEDSLAQTQWRLQWTQQNNQETCVWRDNEEKRSWRILHKTVWEFNPLMNRGQEDVGPMDLKSTFGLRWKRSWRSPSQKVD